MRVYTAYAMSVILVLLLFVAFVGLGWGLFLPAQLARTARLRRHISRRHTSLIFGSSIVLLCILMSLTMPLPPSASDLPDTVQHMNLTTTNTTLTAVSNPAASVQAITQTKAVPFATINHSDATLPNGQIRIIQAGVPGIEIVTYALHISAGSRQIGS